MQNSNEAKMFDFIRQWQQSGLSQKAWCVQQSFAYSSFHYWYKRFRKLQAGSTEVANDNFVKLMVQDTVSVTPWCELVLGNDKKVFFHQPLPASFIRSLVD